MYLSLITGISIIFQFLAALLAVRLIRHTRNRMAWLLISMALIIMTIRRFLPFANAINGQLELVDPVNETSAVVISLLLLIGMLKIAPIFTESSQANEARQQAENNLRESEINLWLAHEAGNIGVWKNDLRTGAVYFDERARVHYGFSTLQTTLSEVIARVHPDDANRLRDEIDAATTPGSDGKVQTEYRVIHPDGQARWLSIYGTVVFEGSGEQCHAVLGFGTSQDITERKRAEDSLMLTEERFSKAFHANPLPMIIIRIPDNRVLVCNRAFEQAAGVTINEMREQPARIVSIFSNPEEQKKIILEFRKNGSVSNFETTLHPRGGEAREVLLSLERITLQEAPCVLAAFLDITDRKTAQRKLEEMNQVLSEAYDQTILGWAHALDLRDKETEGHSRRVTELTLQMAQAMGFPTESLRQLRWGSLLHDIGKMGVPDHILLKPDTLNDAEWAIMRQHPQYAYELLSAISFLRPVLDIPYCHHERWDGSGYPRHLKGEEIPIAARIFAVIDVWDALRSDRPYRAAWSKDDTLRYIAEQAGSHFDPQVAARFISFVEREE